MMKKKKKLQFPLDSFVEGRRVIAWRAMDGGAKIKGPTQPRLSSSSSTSSYVGHPSPRFFFFSPLFLLLLLPKKKNLFLKLNLIVAPCRFKKKKKFFFLLSFTSHVTNGQQFLSFWQKKGTVRGHVQTHLSPLQHLRRLCRLYELLFNGHHFPRLVFFFF